MLVGLTDSGSPDRVAQLSAMRGRRFVSEYGFVDLRGAKAAQPVTTRQSVVTAEQAPFNSATANSFGSPTSRNAKQRSSPPPTTRPAPYQKSASQTFSSVLRRQSDPVADASAARTAPLLPRAVSAVYGSSPRPALDKSASSVKKLTFYRDDRVPAPTDLYKDTPFVNFDAAYPYYSTEGHRERFAAHRNLGPRVPQGATASPSDFRELPRRSQHRPQPMNDVIPMAPMTTITTRHGATGGSARPVYERSVREADDDWRRSSFSRPLGREPPAPGSASPASLAKSAREREERTWHSAMWATSVADRRQRNSSRAGGRTMASSEDSNGHDDSGDEREVVELVDLPPTPEEEMRAAEATQIARAEAIRGSQKLPWQFHAAMGVPLSLLLQRGVSIYAHNELLEYHMHPAFLDDLSVLMHGTNLVKYPRRGGMPHTRHVRIEMIQVAGGEAAFLVWRLHEAAVGVIDRVPLAHLVGVTPDDTSRTFERFAADPRTKEEKERAIRQSMKPHDAFGTASPHPHHTMELAGPDTTMTANVKAHSMLVGPTIEDLRRKLLPRSLCFSLWFVNPVTREPRSLDFVAPNREEWGLWIDAATALVAINSVSAVPTMDETDRRVVSSPGFGMGSEDRLGGRLTESVAPPGADPPTALRTDELMAFAVSRLDYVDQLNATQAQTQPVAAVGLSPS